jgi:hypothetical protein
VQVKEIREEGGRVGTFVSAGEGNKFLGNLVVVKGKDDIPEIKEEDFDGRLIHGTRLSPASLKLAEVAEKIFPA